MRILNPSLFLPLKQKYKVRKTHKYIKSSLKRIMQILSDVLIAKKTQALMNRLFQNLRDVISKKQRFFKTIHFPKINAFNIQSTRVYEKIINLNYIIFYFLVDRNTVALASPHPPCLSMVFLFAASVTHSQLKFENVKQKIPNRLVLNCVMFWVPL